MRKESLTAIFLAFCLLLLPHVNTNAAFSSDTHTLISQTDHPLMPGVTESTLVMNNAEGKQVIAHLNRIEPGARITMKASYGGYYTPGSTPAERAEAVKTLQFNRTTTSSQAAAYEETTGGRIVLASNANVLTDDGIPRGYLIMEGNVFRAESAELKPFFALLKDGSYVIRDCGSDYSDVVEAVSGSFYLVKDGVNVAPSYVGINPVNSLAILHDGSIITFLADGRSEESAGMSYYDQAEFLIAQGAETAIYFDGGGSATCLTRRQGEEELVVRNTPSDGAERKIAATVLFVAQDDTLMFDFDDADPAHYNNFAYGYHDFDASENGLWATSRNGNVTNFSIDHNEGVLNIPVTEDYSGTLGAGETCGPIIKTTNTYGRYPVGNSRTLFPLNYIPSTAEYIQVRFKVTDCVVQDGRTPCVVAVYEHMKSDKTYASSADMKTDFTYEDNVYQTVNIPLNDNFRSSAEIKTIGLRFQNIKSSTGGFVSVDYIYVGGKDKLPVQDHLLFNFTNTEDDAIRYKSKTYGSTNFDLGNWHYRTVYSTPPAFDYEKGSLIYKTTPECPASRDIHTIITSLNHSYTGGHPLRYRPSEGDWLEICMRIDGSPDRDVDFRMLYAKDNDPSSEHVAFSAHVDEEALDRGYFTLSGPLSAEFVSAHEITALRPEIYNLTGAGGQTEVRIEIDYIYVGPEEGAGIDTSLLFDFENSVSAQKRYQSMTYDTYNYDVNGWSGNGEIILNNDHGRLELSGNEFSTSATPLRYYPSSEDVVQVRFRMEECVAQADANLRLKCNDVLLEASAAVTELNTDTYITRTFKLGDDFDRKIESIGCVFENVSGGKIFVDYLYVGRIENAPIQDTLYFSFDNTQISQNRYQSRTYGGYNFDLTQSWSRSTDFADHCIEDGVLKMTAIENTSGYAYLNTGGILEAKPLNYEPTDNDVLQIRLRIDNAVSIDAIESRRGLGRFVLYYGSKTSDRLENFVYYDFKVDDVVDNGWFTLTFDLRTMNRSGARFTDLLQIGYLNPCFNWIKSAEGKTAEFAIDYIYIGIEDELPLKRYEVRFVNYDGSELQSLRIYEGESAIYSATVPTRPYDNENHYEFVGWDQSAEHVTGDLTITAKFDAVPHSYSYTTADNEKHFAHCRCGYEREAAHQWGDGVVSTEPTCVGQGVMTFKCVDCSEVITQAIDATGHSVVIDNAVEADCTNSGLTEGEHCEICKECLIAQTVIPALGHFYETNVTPATCTEDGFTVYTCASCGDAYTADEVSAIGHRYIFTNQGDMHKITCANCDQWNHREAHRYFDGICLCGARESQEPIVEKSLKFNMNISIGAEMVVNYNFMAGSVAAYSDFYLEVKKDVAGAEPIVTTYGIDEKHSAIGILNNPTTGEALLYNASYRGINAKEMGDKFETTLYAIDKDGKIYKSETVISSIKEFLISKLDTSCAEMNTMVVDMLKYGAAAQILLEYDTTNLVTSDLTETQLGYATQQIPEAKNYYDLTGEGANVSTNITVASKVELSLSCIARGLSDPDEVVCVIADEKGTVLAELETETMAEVMFTAKYDNVGAKEMRKLLTASFFVGEEPVSKTVTWSVESYVAQIRANPKSTTEEIALADAMLAYGDAVAAYMVATNQ